MANGESSAGDDGWILSLLRRPVGVTMGLAALLVVGAIAWRLIPLELIPSGLTPPFLFVQIPTLRSAPEDIEARIAIPVEDALATVRGVRQAVTRIEPNSASFILQFGDRTDMDDAYNQVRERLERVSPELGDDAARWLIFKYNPADDPVIWFGATVDASVEDPARAIRDIVVPRLERIPGVSRVDLSGAGQRAVTVEIDEARADAAGTDVVALVQRLSRENFALSAGVLPLADTNMPVRAMARLSGLDDLRAMPVGDGYRLQDVADVRIEDRAERAIYRVNQRPGLFVEVYRDSSANTVQIAEEVRRVLAEDLANDPRAEGIHYHFFFDQGELILGSLRTLQGNAVQGAILAVVVLLIFLRHLAMTLVVALAIPVCLMLTVAVMYFDGWTLNLLTLMGLMLSVGMVVDNAIVVVESVQRRRASGLEAVAAAAKGTSDIALAIAVSTMTTVVVFLPIVLMSGNAVISFYLAQIGFPLCVSLLASLAIAVVVIPLVSARALRTQAPPDPRWMVSIENRYAKVLGWTLRRRADATLIAMLAFASIAIPARTVVSTDQSEPNINDFRVFVNMPESAGWDEREALLLQVEDVLWEHREELGVRDMYTRMGGNRFGRPQVRIFLVDPGERTLSRDETVERALSLLEPPPGVTFTVSWEAPTSAGRTTTISVVGPETRRLAELAEEVARRLRTIEGVVSVRSESSEEGEPEARLIPDRERVFRSGLTAMTVGGLVDFAVRGREVAPLVLPGGDLPVFVSGAAAGENALRRLGMVQIPGAPEGATLGSVVEPQLARGFERIDRENGRTVVTLSIQSARDDVSGLAADIDRVLEDFTFPRGYGLEKGARFNAIALDARDRNFALLLAVVFVFLLMGVLFESFVLPLAIVLSIPFAFTGAWWALWLTGSSLDIMAGVGLVILVGVVVNNAIVLIDQIGDLRASGLERDEAIVEAGRRRLRPIAMTALTTICGLIPMAVGDAGLVGLPYAPMGIALIGGLVASTVLTLVVVPLFYAHFDGLRVAVPATLLGGLRRWIRGPGPAEQPSSGRDEA